MAASSHPIRGNDGNTNSELAEGGSRRVLAGGRDLKHAEWDGANALEGLFQSLTLPFAVRTGFELQEGLASCSWRGDVDLSGLATNANLVQNCSQWLEGRGSCGARKGRECRAWRRSSGLVRGVRLVSSSSALPQVEWAASRRLLQPADSQKETRREAEKVEKVEKEEESSSVQRPPTVAEVLKRPLLGVCWARKDFLLFAAGAFAGAVAKSLTAPLDRVKILMQVGGAKMGAKGGIPLFEAVMKIGAEEGVRGYWKGNLPQVIRIVPYSAVQLFSYEVYKKVFKGNGTELSVLGRLAAGACAGMTSTLVTYPLDTLRFRMAVDPGTKTMTQVAILMAKEEGLLSFYRGLGPSLLGIAPYIALNFCIFDLIKKSLPEDVRKEPVAAFATAFVSATLATTICYPLDTVRRQMQMKGSPFSGVLDAIPGIVKRDGIGGLYRGFVPNALKNLPNNCIRLTTFDSAKNLIRLSELEFEKLVKSRITPGVSEGCTGKLQSLPK